MDKIKLATIIGILFVVTIGGIDYYLKLPTGIEPKTDICTKNGIGSTWKNITEIFYYNATYPAIANYSCSVENSTQWCYKLSATKQTCYILIDPEPFLPPEPPVTSFASQTYTRNKWYLSESIHGIDNYFDFKFTEINNTHWLVEWNWKYRKAIPEEISNLTMKEKFIECSVIAPKFKTACIKELRDWYTPEIEDLEELRSLLEIMWDRGLPSQTKTPNVFLRDDYFDVSKESGSFYLVMPNGFKMNEKVKFGFNSQTYTSGTVTIEYVETLAAPQINEIDAIDTTNNCTSSCIQAGGGLASATNYVFAVYSVAAGGDRRWVNYTRAGNWTTFKTNSTHKSVNISWPTVGNATMYWIKIFSGGTTPYEQYYSWSCNASSSMTWKVCAGYPYVYGATGCTDTACWFYQNTTAILKYAEEYTGNWVGWSGSDYTLPSGHDYALPMYRCWGTGVDIDDFYIADTNFTNNTYITKEIQNGTGATYVPRGQYYINGNLQIGTRNNSCAFTTTAEQISIVQFLFVYNGTFTAGAKSGDIRYQGSEIQMTMPIHNYYIGSIRFDTGTTSYLYGSMLMGSSTARANNYGGVATITTNGTLNIERTTISHLGGLTYYTGANGTIKDSFATDIYYGLRNYAGENVVVDNYEIADTTYGFLVGSLTQMKVSNVIFKTNQFDAYLYLNAILNVTDTVINNDGKIYYLYENNTIYDYKTVNITILNESGKPIPNAVINITTVAPEKWNRTNAGVWTFIQYEPKYSHLNLTTNANGTSYGLFLYRYMHGALTHVIDRSSNETRYQIAQIVISKSGYETLNFTANITEKTKWTLVMQPEVTSINATLLAQYVWNFITRDIHGTITSQGVECPSPYDEYCNFIWNYTERYITGIST